MAVSPYVQAMQELFRANTRSREFPAHGAKVHSVAWSCCGRRLASGSFDKTASVFLLEKDRLVRPLGRGGEQRRDPGWGRERPWGSVLGYGGGTGVWGLVLGHRDQYCGVGAGTGVRGPVLGNGVVTGMYGGGTGVCGVGTGVWGRYRGQGTGTGVWELVLGHRDQYWGMGACTGVYEGDIGVRGPVKENNYRGHGDSVDQLCWHPSNPDLFVTASGDKTIRIWDVRTTKCIATVNTKGENINICWSPDGQTIAVGNKDDVVTFIDAKTHRSKAEEQFKFEVNEISWNNDNNMFFLTNGNGCINILSYPELKPIQSINAHPSNCICIKFDPMGKYFATGSADALVSLWDVDELVCVRCFSRLDWPVRTLSFSHDGKMLASASEDHFIDIAEVETGNGLIWGNSKGGIGWRSAGGAGRALEELGEKLWEVQCESPTFTVAWHPKRPLLAFACDDKDGKYDSSREAGTVKLFGLPNDS
ncbi:THO complex subunit 3 [Aix galericulata]|nr:THO complex subunit 3 [Aix galericulata]